jgi:hypothetical protein
MFPGAPARARIARHGSPGPSASQLTQRPTGWPPEFSPPAVQFLVANDGWAPSSTAEHKLSPASQIQALLAAGSKIFVHVA